MPPICGLIEGGAGRAAVVVVAGDGLVVEVVVEDGLVADGVVVDGVAVFVVVDGRVGEVVAPGVVIVDARFVVGVVPAFSDEPLPWASVAEIVAASPGAPALPGRGSPRPITPPRSARATRTANR